jgi:Fe-S cluster biogenesis protein NfuA/nitrite reductase/ring-hydroxylating ferredoxin subunit
MDDLQTRARVERVELLLEQVETLTDPVARETATELVGALLDLYGEGLARLTEHVPDGDALVDDELISHLLLLHGIHPVPLEARVRSALDEVRPYLASHGGNVELVSVDEGVVRLRMEGSCSGCPSSTMTLKLAIEEAIHKAAPDVEEIEAEGATAPAGAPSTGLIQLTSLQPAAPAANGEWATVGQLRDLPEGGVLLKNVADEPVLFLGLLENTYAYRPDCPACGHSLEHARLRAAELTCPGCGHRYDAIRAGRCVDDHELHLEPVPLLVDDAGLVKVALTPAPA